MKKPENNRKDVLAYVKRAKKNGNCISCGKKAVNLRHCDKHRLMENEYSRERYRRKKIGELIDLELAS